MFSSWRSPITLIAAATSRMFSSRLLAVTTTVSRVVASGGAASSGSSCAHAGSAVAQVSAAATARVRLERWQRCAGLIGFMLFPPESPIRDHDPNQRIVNSFGKTGTSDDLSRGCAGVLPIAQDLDAIDEHVVHAGRVLLRCVIGRVVGDR